MSAVIQIADPGFVSTVLHGRGPVLVEFWKEGCGPCTEYAPVVADLAGRRPDITVVGYRIEGRDPERRLWKRHNIEMTPTVILFVDGQEVARSAGVMTRRQIEDGLAAYGYPQPPTAELEA